MHAVGTWARGRGVHACRRASRGGTCPPGGAVRPRHAQGAGRPARPATARVSTVRPRLAPGDRVTLASRARARQRVPSHVMCPPADQLTRLAPPLSAPTPTTSCPPRGHARRSQVTRRRQRRSSVSSAASWVKERKKDTDAVTAAEAWRAPAHGPCAIESNAFTSRLEPSEPPWARHPYAAVVRSPYPRKRDVLALLEAPQGRRRKFSLKALRQIASRPCGQAATAAYLFQGRPGRNRGRLSSVSCTGTYLPVLRA